jgi:hypothetical protein
MTTHLSVFAYLRSLQCRHGTCSYPAAMSKSSKRSKRSRGSRSPVDRSATTDIVTQLEVAIKNPHAAAIGSVIGGLVPWFGRTLAHGEIQETWSSNRPLAIAMVAVVLGCGVFSGLSVYKFGRAAFGDPRKALGFVLALEGVMLVSHGVTSAVALGVLILINAVSNGSVIALARDATRRKRDSDARGAATRARTRATGSVPGTKKPEAQDDLPLTESPLKEAPAVKAPSREHVSQESVALQTRPVRWSGSEPARIPVIPVRWRRASLEDVSDAEIVSEKFLA